MISNAGGVRVFRFTRAGLVGNRGVDLNHIPIGIEHEDLGEAGLAGGILPGDV